MSHMKTRASQARWGFSAEREVTADGLVPPARASGNKADGLPVSLTSCSAALGLGLQAPTHPPPKKSAVSPTCLSLLLPQVWPLPPPASLPPLWSPAPSSRALTGLFMVQRAEWGTCSWQRNTHLRRALQGLGAAALCWGVFASSQRDLLRVLA